MKKVVVLVGPNGVGKSTTAETFMHQHTKCADIDSDACRAINPFPLTLATKKAVIENIYCLLTAYGTDVIHTLFASKRRSIVKVHFCSWFSFPAGDAIIYYNY